MLTTVNLDTLPYELLGEICSPDVGLLLKMAQVSKGLRSFAIDFLKRTDVREAHLLRIWRLRQPNLPPPLCVQKLLGCCSRGPFVRHEASLLATWVREAYGWNLVQNWGFIADWGTALLPAGAHAELMLNPQIPDGEGVIFENEANVFGLLKSSFDPPPHDDICSAWLHNQARLDAMRGVPEILTHINTDLESPENRLYCWRFLLTYSFLPLEMQRDEAIRTFLDEKLLPTVMQWGGIFSVLFFFYLSEAERKAGLEERAREHLGVAAEKTEEIVCPVSKILQRCMIAFKIPELQERRSVLGNIGPITALSAPEQCRVLVYIFRAMQLPNSTVEEDSTQILQQLISVTEELPAEHRLQYNIFIAWFSLYYDRSNFETHLQNALVSAREHDQVNQCVLLFANTSQDFLDSCMKFLLPEERLLLLKLLVVMGMADRAVSLARTVKLAKNPELFDLLQHFGKHGLLNDEILEGYTDHNMVGLQLYKQRPPTLDLQHKVRRIAAVTGDMRHRDKALELLSARMPTPSWEKAMEQASWGNIQLAFSTVMQLPPDDTQFMTIFNLFVSMSIPQ